MRPVPAGVVLLLALSAWAAASAWAAPLAAQTRGETSEPRILAEAQRLEARGELGDAESVLRELLERHPTSSGGLFALERVLRAQGRLTEILPVVDAFLRRDAGFSGARLLRLRALVEADSLDAARAAMEAWIAVDPRSPEPYRESAAVAERAFGPEEALAVLRRGAAAIEEGAPLAVETGDLLLRLGRVEEAAREWDRALGDEGAQLPAILQRVGTAGGPGHAAAGLLVEALRREPTTAPRRRAAAQLAVESGMEEDAIRLAREALPGMTESARRGFLAGLARQADAQGLSRMTLWVFGTMREGAADPVEALALDREIASLAVAAGDTALALEAQERLARELPRASRERRLAAADAVRLAVGIGTPEEVQRRLDRFREDFPGAPETDELAIGVARLWMARENRAAALRVLEDVSGPRSALERAYLGFAGREPDLAGAKTDLAAAVEGLRGRQATEVIQLLSLLGRVGEDAGLLAGRAAALGHRGDAAAAAALVHDGIDRLPPADRPALLAHGARLADGAPVGGSRGPLRERKVAFLTRLVNDFPDAPEAPEAMLRLARHHLEEGGRRDAAEELLETLILTRPESPVVPDARRELQRLRQRPAGARSP